MSKLSVVRCPLSVVGGSSATNGPRTTDHGPRTRSGLTLVELLITILIIGMLAAMVLGVAAVAGTTAREAKTRNMINRLHTLLAEQYDTYKTRRVKVRQDVINAINGSSLSPAQMGAALAEARLYALREMMLMEMPDRWSDVLLAAVPGSPSGVFDAQNPYFLEQRTDLANVYLRRYARLVANSNNDDVKILANQSAECLYMVVMLACGDGEAPSMFHASDIGDTDGDGAPEFLDGWGNPIAFLRWAPGFESEIQLNLNVLQSMPPADANLAVAGDHDPNDMYRVEPIAFRLVPLVYSAGRDEEYGLLDEPDVPIWRSFAGFSVPNLNASGPPYFLFPRLSPFQKGMPGLPDDYLGTDDGTKTSTDNIHNHLIGTR